MNAKCGIGEMQRRPSRRGRVGFTLIELLVVIAVIAVLTAIAIPALAKSRRAAREAACLSNQRQIVAAWLAYVNDYRTFPFGDVPNFKAGVAYAWGGVHWYEGVATPPNNIPGDRPLNPYLGGEVHQTTGMEVFRCPLDSGMRTYGTNFDALSLSAPYSNCPTPNTEYGCAGTSYRANDWMYCVPGRLTGWGGFPTFPFYRTNQSPDQVQVSPSMFMVVRDDGPANWAESLPGPAPLLSGEWWHGENQTAIGFLDGHARRGRGGGVVAEWYTLHMVPVKLPYTGWRWPGKQ